MKDNDLPKPRDDDPDAEWIMYYHYNYQSDCGVGLEPKRIREMMNSLGRDTYRMRERVSRLITLRERRAQRATYANAVREGHQLLIRPPTDRIEAQIERLKKRIVATKPPPKPAHEATARHWGQYYQDKYKIYNGACRLNIRQVTALVEQHGKESSVIIDQRMKALHKFQRKIAARKLHGF